MNPLPVPLQEPNTVLLVYDNKTDEDRENCDASHAECHMQLCNS